MIDKKRGQISHELMFSLGIIFIIFIMLLFYSFDKKKDNADEAAINGKRFDCQKILISAIQSRIMDGASFGFSTTNPAVVNSISQYIDNGYICYLPSRSISNSSGSSIFNLTGNVNFYGTAGVIN